MPKMNKSKGRSQSGRLSDPPDSTVCCYCGQKKRKMVAVQPKGWFRSYPACAECRKEHDGQWRYPR
jgi:hypothetical protein